MPTLTRRDVLCALGVGALTARSLRAQGAPLVFDAIDHVEFYVSDVERTRAFLAKVFGAAVLRNASASKSYLRVGSAYLAFEKPRAGGSAATTDHVSLAIRDLAMPRVHALLDSHGIAYRDYPSGRDTAVVDADGIRTQLSPENGWNALRPPTFVPDKVDLTEPALFRPVGIEHVLLNVADPDASAAFYAQFLGPVSLRRNDRTWFQLGKSRLGLLKTPSGQKPGVNHFCVSAERFDYGAAVARLMALGARVEAPELPGAPSFQDPDGMLIQVSPVA